MMPFPFARAVAWWRHFRRDRPALLIAAHQHEETLRNALHAEAERVWPDGPAAAARWPDCDPADPCGTRWNGDSDRAEWHTCVSHPPRGRHNADATVTDISERRRAH